MKIGFIDIETTGFDCKNGDILQVGLIVKETTELEDGTIWHTSIPYCRTYHTDRPENEIVQAIEVNRLTENRISFLRSQDELENGHLYDRHFLDDLEYWQPIIDSLDLVVAHNAPFDTSWLKHHGLKFTDKKIICTQSLMSKKHPQKYRWSLKRSFEYFYPNEYDETQAHSALYDVQLCMKVHERLTN